ncbi:hypothetical protein E0Z10_g870 [Xylaria hypoxylon]|uniref:Uncharacterized protein n=1 Tax=Xylaria hypoxylon TaxID=37992 RepID=A0A4Z0YU57_9PEZI|nr:hypothetical protein E0Z10_g870 [Xylaria hypoxylon]
MHRRNSTNPRRLDRRKSTTSVKSVHLEYIPPETAERDARVAAAQAFARARERSTTDSNLPLWPPPRSPYPKARPDDPPLHRQQSIRFVQPRPFHPAPNNIMAQDTPPSCISHDPNHHVANVEVDPRPSSSAAASGMVYATKGAAGDYINTLFTSDEYYTPEDDIASMPSSYRRLRKSRSMFTNRPTATISEHSNLSKSSASANQLPFPANSYFRPYRGDENVPPRRLKTPRSMSFLREFRDSIVPAFRSEDDATPFTPMNGYIGSRDGPKYSIRPKSSKFFRAKTTSQDRVFRKSMRDASNSTVSINGTTTKSGSLRYRARKVSQGFKHKLKNLFGLGKDDGDDARLPLQHIDAQRSHIFGWGDLQHETDDELLCIAPADRGALSRVASGIPSLHAVPSYRQLRSRQGSLDSLRSEHKASDERSRVTSWSNSDANTVITHSSCREERERKRLSIINENGAHMCSSSAQFATISEQSNASTTSLCRPAQAAPMIVDGHRIYSALLKRMGYPQQEHTSIPEIQHGADDIVQLGTIPRRQSALRLQRFDYEPTATIRYVFPESEEDPESPNTDKRLHMKDQGSPSKSPLSAANRAKEGGHGHLASVSVNGNAGDVSSRGIDNGAVSASSMEGPPPLVRTLSSRSSAFFGSPTRHLFRAQSPYRRVLQDRIHTASDEQPIRSPEFNPWMRSLSNLPNLPMRRSSTYGSDADIKLHYTESIYSTNTEDGQTQRHSFLSVVEDFPRPASTHGDVTIFVNPPGHSKRSSSLPPKQRVTSSSSSIEWKMWLSSNVSKLEETTTQVDSNDFQHGLSSARFCGHVREHAQIDDEEEEEEDQIPKLPDTPSRVRGTSGGSSNLDYDDDEDDDQPTPFDAGDKDTEIGQRQIPFEVPLPTDVSASNMVSPVTYPKQAGPGTSTGAFAVNHEKELPRVPSLKLKANSSNGHANIATKLTKRQPKAKTSMTPLTSRSLSSTGEGQAGKTNSSTNSRRKLYSITSTKPENVSPATISDDDLYGIEGAGVLGPNQQTVGSKRMVDIFLSSRRRRMASDEGSVFL